MNNELVSQGIELMIFGMGTVFVFLAVLVVVVMCLSTIVNKFFPEDAAPVKPAPQGAQTVQQTDDATLLAVISAAVHQYRSRQK